MSVNDEKTSLIGLSGFRKESSLMYSTKEKLPDGKTSVIGAAFIVSNAALGAGMLSVPYAFWTTGGPYAGLGVEVAVVVISFVSLWTLALCAEVSRTGTVQELLQEMTGPFGGFIADVVVFLYALAGCITYVAVIGDQIEDFASAFNLNVSTGNGTFTEDSLAKQWYMSRPFIVPAVSVLFILPFLMLKNIGALSWTSFLGITACLYIAGVIVVKYGIFAAHGHVYPCDIPRPKTVSRQCSPVSWEDFFNSFPLLCFAYQCQMSSLPVYSGLKKRSLKRFSCSLFLALCICFVVYTPVGLFGLLIFEGGCIQGDILRNFCPNDIAVDVGRLFLVVALVTTYPIPHYCGRTVAESMLKKTIVYIGRRKGEGFIEVWQKRMDRWEGTRLRLFALLWFITTLALGVFIPTILVVVRPAGALAALFVFVFPGVCLLKYIIDYWNSFKGERHFKLKMSLALTLSIFFIVGGAFVFGNSWTSSIMSDAHLI